MVDKLKHGIISFALPLAEAAHVRKEYDESSKKLSKIQSRISSLSEKLKHDFGKSVEAYLCVIIYLQNVFFWMFTCSSGVWGSGMHIERFQI